MKFISNKSQGFSVIEMTLASFLVLSISAVSYKVLTSQTNKQITSIQNQKNDNISQVALSRFKADTSLIDPNLVRYGVAPIWPHQGYGLGQNYYQLSTTEQTALGAPNDGVTIMRRAPKSDRLYVAVGDTKRLCYPSTIVSGDRAIYNHQIQLDSVAGLAVGDWMLLYQAGHYALGVIEDVETVVTQVANNTNSNVNSGSAGMLGGSEQSEMTMGDETNSTEGDESASSLVNNYNRYVAKSGEENMASNGSGNSSAVTISQGVIRLRAPNAAESQHTGRNLNGYSNGFVTKAGVVPASFDMSGIGTTSSDDNSYCFDTSKANFQKVSPVSYYIDYRTSDGLNKTTSNAYYLDKKSGKQVKMLVRAEYVNGVEKREYLAPINELGFTYDLIDRSGSSDQIARNVGRAKNASFLQNVGSDPTTAVSGALTSYQIVSMKMNLGFTFKDSNKNQEEIKQNREFKIALDPSIQEDAYRSTMKVASSLTDNLNTISETGASNEQIGKPLYLINGDANKNEVIVPVSAFRVADNGAMAEQGNKGSLYVYDSAGCSVNAKNGCDPSANKSAIQFSINSRSVFFPNTVAEVELANGDRKILVGGVAMENTDKNGITQVERKPGLGVIILKPGETLASKLEQGNGTSTCNIKDCNWYPIDKRLDKAPLVDTAHLAVDPARPNDIYVATMTKQNDENSKSSVFKGVWDGSSYAYSEFAKVAGTEEGRIVSAISDRTISIGDSKYLAVCVTKKMSSSCGGECIPDVLPERADDGLFQIKAEESNSDPRQGKEEESGSESRNAVLGEIQLIKQGSGINEPGITLIHHNYRCSAINVDQNNNLIVSGRLTVQPISYTALKKAVEYDGKNLSADQQRELLNKNILYLDEAVAVNGNQTVYADYYQVDPLTYQNQNKAQYIGWITGMSTVEFSDGTFGMVNGNKYRLAGGYAFDKSQMQKVPSSDTEYSNAGILKIELAGMSDRVVATIETDPNNMNNSIISATYAKRSNELPSVYIPGSFWIDPRKVRSTPTPLPSVSPSMSESSWFTLYQALLTPKDPSSLNSTMPTLSNAYTKVDVNCANTKPKTCQ